MACHETLKSPAWDKDGAVDRTFVVYDVLDDVQAVAGSTGLAGTDYFGRIRDPFPNAIRRIGYSIWEIIWHYAPLPDGDQEDEPPAQPPDLSAVLEFDTTGGTSHITQCLEQTDYGAEAGTQVKDAKVIGASGDSVEGTDVVVPKLSLSLSRIPPLISGNYIKNLSRLTGQTNVGPYIIRGKVLGVYVEVEFEDGELMFLGAAPTGEGKDGRFVYKFEASENRTKINVGDGLDGAITVPTKKGWQYLWLMFKKRELTTPAVAIPVPHIAFVATVSPSSSFVVTLGF